VSEDAIINSENNYLNPSGVSVKDRVEKSSSATSAFSEKDNFPKEINISTIENRGEGKEKLFIEEAKNYQGEARLRILGALSDCGIPIPIMDAGGIAGNPHQGLFSDPVNTIFEGAIKDFFNSVTGQKQTNYTSDALQNITKLYKDERDGRKMVKEAEKGNYEPIKAKLSEEMEEINKKLQKTSEDQRYLQAKVSNEPTNKEASTSLELNQQQVAYLNKRRIYLERLLE
jgi:hypothetical protein